MSKWPLAGVLCALCGTPAEAVPDSDPYCRACQDDAALPSLPVYWWQLVATRWRRRGTGSLYRPALHPHNAGMHSRGYREAWDEPDQVLNVGSGGDYREGWTNMDFYASMSDVRHDWLQTPWPFPDDAFDGIHASQVIEHLPPLVDGRDALGVFLAECCRVLRPGGRIGIGVPLVGTPCDTANPTHYRRFDWYSFNWCTNGSTVQAMYGHLPLRRIYRGYSRAFITKGRHSALWTEERFGRAWNIGPRTGLVFVLRHEPPTRPAPPRPGMASWRGH